MAFNAGNDIGLSFPELRKRAVLSELSPTATLMKDGENEVQVLIISIQRTHSLAVK